VQDGADTNVTPSSRHVPAPTRRAVHARDGGQCAYRDAHGHRCSARAPLEYHHRQTYGYGGDHSVDNVALLCRNRFLAEVDYGVAWMVKGSRASAERPAARSVTTTIAS
jgi:5-methylcytosine-specific restriction endonuclease McrA